MRKSSILLLPILSVLILALPAQTKEPALVFTQATVIDVVRGQTQTDMTVVIEGERITALGKTGKVKVPQNAHVVNATGKFLMPGLWDMHVHSLRETWLETFFPLFLANGVTGVRDMGVTLRDAQSSLEEFARSRLWRDEVADGRRVGPRVVAAGLIIDGPRSIWPFALRVSDVTGARKAVQDLKATGADFVKVYSFLPRDAYHAILDEAKKLGMAVAGHAPERLTVAEVSDAGQKCIEHLSNLLLACSTDEADLRKSRIDSLDRRETLTGKDGGTGLSRLVISQNMRILDTYDEQKAKALFERFQRNGTWQVPTLTVLRAATYGTDENFLSSQKSRLKYVIPSLREWWGRSQGAIRLRNESADIAEGSRKALEKNLKIVGKMNQAGVGILAGTDAPNPYVVPGISLHDELELLVNAGLTPEQALQTATINPAMYLGLEKTLGTVAEGKIADLVLLEANPLEDIGNTRQISAVVANGRYFSGEELQRMLAEVETAAARK